MERRTPLPQHEQYEITDNIIFLELPQLDDTMLRLVIGCAMRLLQGEENPE
jgi:hypothetical protein